MSTAAPASGKKRARGEDGPAASAQAGPLSDLASVVLEQMHASDAARGRPLVLTTCAPNAPTLRAALRRGELEYIVTTFPDSGIPVPAGGVRAAASSVCFAEADVDAMLELFVLAVRRNLTPYERSGVDLLLKNPADDAGVTDDAAAAAIFHGRFRLNLDLRLGWAHTARHAQNGADALSLGALHALESALHILRAALAP